MRKQDFKYIFRYAVQSGFHEDEKIENLLSFCKETRIDDVMFFINCEELNQGHLTKEETAPWMKLISRCKEKLTELSITTSINPWITFLHSDRGRTLKYGQNFNLMVDPYGNQATAVACPLCEEFQKFLIDKYTYFATLQPNMLWIEDDFRFHNHSPLIWGGCFCDKHMEEYEKRAEKKLSREEFVQGVLKSGKPHPYRKIWLDTARETLVKLAENIGRAVHQVSPMTRVGLMSSNPVVHCAEGRDWEGILKGLAGNTSMVDRIHLPAYNEMAAQNYMWGFNQISTLTQSIIPKDTEIYPELECWPNTRFSKSKTFTTFQLETSTILGSKGITLNIFDMMGNGIMMNEGYQNVLRDTKDFLNAITKLGLNHKNQKGVKILFNSDSSYTLETINGKSMEELYPQETVWAGLLSAYGIANTYNTTIEHKNSIVAVSGQYFRNYKKEQIKLLFENNFVILDGDAAFTLYDMGLGYLAGLENVKWHQMNTGFQSYEQVCDGKIYCGMKEVRTSSQNFTGDYLDIKSINEPYLITKVKNPSGKTVGNGMAIYEHKVFILPYGRYNGQIKAHLHPLRQEVLQNVLLNSNIGIIPEMVKQVPYVMVYSFDLEEKTVLVIVNASNDDIDEVKIYAPQLNINNINEMNNINKQLIKARVQREGEDIILKSGIKRMELKILLES